jgi:cytoskeleton protein RodZ
MGIGAKLRTTREQKGYLLADLADFLRIQETYLEAIEADDFAPMLKNLGSAYVNGFIRTYARQLGVDPDAAVAEFQQEQTAAADMPPLIVRQPIEEQRLPSWRLIVLAVLALLAMIIVWNYLHADPVSVSEVVPPVPDESQQMAAIRAPVQKPVQMAPSTATGESEDSDEAPEPPVKTYVPQQVASNPAPVVAAPAITASGTAEMTRVAIHAVDNSWIQIRDPAGNAVFAGILHAGETYQVPDQPGYTMTAGNAGGIELSVDNVPRPVLGEVGQVIHNVPLDAARIAGR